MLLLNKKVLEVLEKINKKVSTVNENDEGVYITFRDGDVNIYLQFNINIYNVNVLEIYEELGGIVMKFYNDEDDNTSITLDINNFSILEIESVSDL